MAGSVEQSAFVITATLWSQGRAAVSPGGVGGGDHRGCCSAHQGTKQTSRGGVSERLVLLHEPIFCIFEDTFPSNREH